ncbi:type II secretion system protein [Photobacterium damselae subsp. damselae]|uniref:type II secretion system protein n=1 Tax=Photobacterium damselae TaxID=38293 RepID=UPI001302AA36|nr:type II secretion system protein [Photobacterium damselae]NVO61441.1 type II secretion system protein [Photobacterium damselae subsp. damselae]UKA06579.1 type II secretion system GspH family protein [Photobacterium damselae subsp. damselae]
MKRQGGFTLIELVVVIVILGILAVTAAPKFMNLQNDARNASLQGLKGAIEGAAGIVYGKAAIKGIEATAAGSKVGVSAADGTLLTTAYGYPTANTAGIQKAVNGLSSTDGDWTCQEVNGSNPTALQCTFKGKDSYFANDASGNCYVKYTQAASGAVATTTVVATGNACKTN